MSAAPTVSQPVSFSRFTIDAVDTFVLRAPTARPIRTSFGIMHDRPAVLIRIMDEEGVAGWGEVWCNFPAVAAEHRARLVETVLAPELRGTEVTDPAQVFEQLVERTRILTIQSGEDGPFAQAIAGVDTALWDLAAKRNGMPLWQFLGGSGQASVPVYASGINPDAPERIVEEQRDRGFRAFKLKIGFGRATDLENVARVRALLGPSAPLMVDANQAWSLDEAIVMSGELEPFSPQWLEEPLAADRPLADWRTLADATSIPLAAGENVRGADNFGLVARTGAIAVIQPDLAKWGGISGCRRALSQIRDAGLRYCPHFLGSGVGLLASAHLLKAMGGDGLLEVDINNNPLQRELTEPFPNIDKGHVFLPDGPGLGVIPHVEIIEKYRCRS